jgi:hypothetical protein
MGGEIRAFRAVERRTSDRHAMGSRRHPMKTFSKLISVLSLAVPAIAVAEPLPKPIANTECLVGTWTGGGSMTMGKEKAKVEATWTCKRTSVYRLR